jgi:hypothetical protein
VASPDFLTGDSEGPDEGRLIIYEAVQRRPREFCRFHPALPPLAIVTLAIVIFTPEDAGYILSTVSDVYYLLYR